MIKLYDNGVYLVNGTDIVEDNGEAAVALTAKCGQAPSKQEVCQRNHGVQYFRGSQHLWKYGTASD